MFNVHKVCAGYYNVTTRTGTFEVVYGEMGYGDSGWLITYPDGCYGDPCQTKAQAYEYIRAYTEMYPANEDCFDRDDNGNMVA